MAKEQGLRNSDLQGIIPPVTTPFTADGEIDEEAFRAQIRFVLGHGVHGLAVGGSTGEGHALSTDEIRRLVAVAVEEVAGRVPVIAGIIVDSTRQAVERGRAVADLGVAALQITPVHYLFRPTDDATVAHFRTVADETTIPIIIYNVVPWTYCSPDLLDRIFREVPGVIGVKQSNQDLKLLADLILMAGDRARIFSAVDALLYPSFALGAHGSISAILTAAPRQCVALWDAVLRGDHGTALSLHRELLVLWNALWGDNLPACVKHALTLQGCPAGYPRAPMSPASPAQQDAIRAALGLPPLGATIGPGG